MQIPDFGLQLLNTCVESGCFIISDVEFLDDSCVLLLGGVKFGLQAKDDLVAVVYLRVWREWELGHGDSKVVVLKILIHWV